MKENIKVINSIEGIEFLRVSLETIALSWNLPKKVLLELNLILEELCTNYMEHAGEPPKSFLEVQMVLDGSLVVITVKDKGKPFDPTKIPDPDINLSIDKRKTGGLGLYFVKNYSDSIMYARKDGSNVVTITKSLNLE